MNKRLRRALKWAMWAGIVVGLLIALQVTALAFPQPWFAHKHMAGNCVFYSDREFDASLRLTADEVLRRLEAVEIYDETITQRVFICHDEGRYNLFAGLSLVPTRVAGFNLSVFNNSYISIPNLRVRRARSIGFPPYSAIAGGLAHCITHELVHDFTQEQIGFFNYLGLPRWKTEGYAEYGASLAVSRDDTTATLEYRIGLLQTQFSDDRPRDYYRCGLLVEFLAEQRGWRFADIMHDSLTRDFANEQMLRWYEESGSR